MKGATHAMSESTVKYEFECLEMPILLKKRVKTYNTIKPELFSGISFALNLETKLKIEYPEPFDVFFDEETDLKDYMRDIDVGLVVGGGIIIDTTLTEIMIDDRCTWGLFTMDTYALSDIHNFNIQFMIGISL